MSIEAEITVTLAAVEVADDYRVELTTHDRETVLTWSEAEQLANELIEGVVKAKRMLAEDFPVPNLAHGFDVAPSCRDCVEGKHAACIGSTFVETDEEIAEVECGCSKVDHQVLGGVS